MTDTYYIKSFISVCEVLWACWLPMCCCVNTLNLRQWYMGHFWGSWIFLKFIYCYLFVNLSRRYGRQLYMKCVFSPFPHKFVMITVARFPSAIASKCCQGIVVPAGLTMIAWRRDTWRKASHHQTQVDTFKKSFQYFNHLRCAWLIS